MHGKRDQWLRTVGANIGLNIAPHRFLNLLRMRSESARARSVSFYLVAAGKGAVEIRTLAGRRSVSFSGQSVPPMTSEQDREELLRYFTALLADMDRAEILAMRDHFLATKAQTADVQTIVEILDGHLALRDLAGG